MLRVYVATDAEDYKDKAFSRGVGLLACSFQSLH